MYGDADNDDFVDIKDCTYVQKCIDKVVVQQDYSYYMLVADLNCDSYVDIRDITILQKYLCGINTFIPIDTHTKPSTLTSTTDEPTTPPEKDDDGYNNQIYKP